jgi:CRISPR-associated exonuclease Cas4
MFSESDLIPISALQHFVFCPRQCALIHLEGSWDENVLTVQGENLHRKAHLPGVENRPGLKKTFDMPLRSLKFGIVGKADVVLKYDEKTYVPLEYKHGKPKVKEMDTVQVCAQALCLEEMNGVKIEKGLIYYFGIKKRIEFSIDDDLRSKTANVIKKVRELFESSITPPPVYSKRCKSCSLYDECLPELFQKPKKVGVYMSRVFEKLEKPDGENL